MPGITAYTTPLSGSAQNNQTFQWTPLLDKCFQSIKVIAMRSPILKPVDFNKNEPVWVITDSSQMGISAMYGQGTSWDTCRPAGFLSKKFMSAQHNYHMHEHETLAVLEVSWNGRINFWVESLQWSQTTKVLNISRHNQTCCWGRQGGGNTFPTLIIIPST